MKSPDRTFISDAGLLSPEGEFYSCGFCEHDSLAQELGFESAWHMRDRDGWQHLSDGWSRPLRAPTQAQFTAIFEWQQASPGRLLPPWFEETIAA